MEEKIEELTSETKDYEKLKKSVDKARSVELGIPDNHWYEFFLIGKDIQHQLEDCTRAVIEWQEKTQIASKKYEDLTRKLHGYVL